MSGPTTRVGGLLVSMLVVLLVTPVAAQVASPSPGASQPADPAPASLLSPAASALAVEAQAIVAEVFAQAVESPDAAVADAREAELARTGLAEIDPALPRALAELEAQAAERFATFLAEVPPFPEPSDEPSAGAALGPEAAGSPEPSSEAGTSAYLAAARPAAAGPGRRFAQGGSYVSSIGQVLGLASREVADFKPSKGSGRSDPEPYASGGSRYRIAQAFDRDTLTLIIELTERYEVPGPTPESPSFTVTDTGGTTLQVDTCPDEDGTIVVTANASGSYDVVGEGLTYHATLDTRDAATVTVNDEAEIAGRQHALTVRGTATGDRPAFAGGEGAADSELAARLTWSGSLGSGVTPGVVLDRAEGVDTRDLRSAFTGGAFTAALVDAAIDAAAQVWQGGRCLELEVDPPGRRVDPGSETEITVKIKHKAFDEEVERDVEATLEGTERLEPLGEPGSAPDTFTYTATDEQQGEGTITFRSVSDRGIAEERAERYWVDLRLVLDAEGSLTIELGGMRYRTTYRGRGLKVVVVPGGTPDAPPRISIEGDLALRGRVRGLLGQARCSGSFRKSAAIDAGADVSAQIVGEGEDRRLLVQLAPRDPDATIDFPMRCTFRPIGRRNVPYSVEVRDMWPLWSGPGTAVELPLTGGSASDRQSAGAARYDSELTLRADEGD